MTTMGERLAQARKREEGRPEREKQSLSDALVNSYGVENISKNSNWGRLIQAAGVPRSGEFRRIEALPRRKWEQDGTLEEATKGLTKWLRLEGGHEKCGPDCKCPRELWPNQAAALIEATTVGGMFGPIAVGNGKALISLLLPVVLKSKRPLLFVPAQLRDQTNRRVLPMTRKHWVTHPRLEVRGYSELSVARNKRMLYDLEPDLIILDEAHNVKNPQAARTKRLKEYMRDFPETRVVALSGTMTKRSLRDYWQLLAWTHKPDLMPLPMTWKEMTTWADALDEFTHRDAVRQAPGALVRFCEEGESTRDGYRRRLVETPGVIASSARELGVSLEIIGRRAQVPDQVRGMMARMRATWETPYGDLITEPVELWRHMRELACGFYYRWDPPPPRDWADARKAWKKYVRETLKHNRRGLDSELLVANEAHQLEKAGKAPEQWLEWQAVKDTYEVNQVAEWVSDFAIRDAMAWANTKGETPGIVWTEHVAFAERLAEESGLRYFGAGMKAAAEIGDAEGTIIASQTAHGEGKNLQRWSRNLITSPASAGKTWEQLLGRTHRQGQEADVVVAEVWTHAEELVASLRQAIADAEYIEETLGARQKLCYADIAVEGL